MYHIICNGVELGAAERLTHAKKQQNGCVIIAADGNLLAYNGSIYNVDGQPQTDGYDQVLVVWADDLTDMLRTAKTLEAQLAVTQAAMDELILG